MDFYKTNEYYIQKINLLKQCLKLSEDLMSSLIDWESLDGILSKRENIIEQLQKLNQTIDKDIVDSCTQEQIFQIDHLVKLILAFDKDTSKLLENEQMNTMQLIKANLLEQKLMNYASAPEIKSGMLLNYKK